MVYEIGLVMLNRPGSRTWTLSANVGDYPVDSSNLSEVLSDSVRSLTGSLSLYRGRAVDGITPGKQYYIVACPDRVAIPVTAR